MQDNLHRVFGERNAGRRLEAVRELYVPDAILYEPDAVATGFEAIANAVGGLLRGLPADFAFTALGSAVGHHGSARLHWKGGPPNGPVMVMGTDVVELSGSRIRSLFIFIDPASS
jgi:hypothetical protein